MMASTAVKPAGVRDGSWRRKEILDLLALWGDAKVQQVLKSSSQNINCFEETAEQMAARGHTPSDTECSSKAKAMRLPYKRVVSHNNRSGAGHVECPFYEKLDSILKGDVSVTLLRVVRSLNLKHKLAEPTSSSSRELSPNFPT